MLCDPGLNQSMCNNNKGQRQNIGMALLSKQPSIDIFSQIAYSAFNKLITSL